MKCLILAAGYATRLYPLTENFPKPLLKVGDKTIVDWLIDDLRTANVIDEFVIISNHKYAKHFEEWAAIFHGSQTSLLYMLWRCLEADMISEIQRAMRK